MDTKSDFNKPSVVVTPEKEMQDPAMHKTQIKKAGTKSWVRDILRAEPCIVTQKGLLLALKHKAPAHVIRFLVTVNPNIMNFPKKGPTPLQEAVRRNASLDVIEVLLEASPFGLCMTNHDFPENPLEYAKRHHGDRPGLIELLSRPLKYWIPEHNRKFRDPKREQQHKGISEFPSYSNFLSRYACLPLHYTTNQKVPLLSPPNSFSARQSRSRSIISSSTASESSVQSKEKVLRESRVSSTKSNLQSGPSKSYSSVMLPKKDKSIEKKRIDREEMNNIKNICAHLCKSQRKMAKQINEQSDLLANMGTKDDILKDLMKEQRSQMFRNWVALDIKERAYLKKLNEMEQRYVLELEKRLERWTGSMRLWNESTRGQLQELQIFMDLEAETNEKFRNNMTDWIERHQEDKENNASVPSHIFATNLGEIDERVPLCSAIRGAICGHDTLASDDETDPETDPIIDVRVKKRPWRPLFKNRDRIPLSEDL